MGVGMGMGKRKEEKPAVRARARVWSRLEYPTAHGTRLYIRPANDFAAQLPAAAAAPCTCGQVWEGKRAEGTRAEGMGG